MRRIALSLISAFAALLSLAAQEPPRAFTIESVPNVHVHDARRYVSDPAGLIPAAARDTIDALFGRLEATTGIEAAVVALPSIGDATPFGFAQSLFRHWGIGKKGSNNGLLVLYVADQRSIRIHVGYGLEGFLTDAKCKRIQSQQMVPAFRKGDTGGALVAGSKAICAVLDGTMEPEKAQDDSGNMAAIVLIIIILAMVLYATGTYGHRKKRCPSCGKRAMAIMSSDRYRAPNGHTMRKDVYVCSKCGRVTVQTTDEGDDDDRHSRISSFLGGFILGSLLSGGRGGSGSGGGYSGGSFGGGDSGGGGAESNW